MRMAAQMRSRLVVSNTTAILPLAAHFQPSNILHHSRFCVALKIRNYPLGFICYQTLFMGIMMVHPRK